MKKAVITAVALTLVLCLAVGGTLAYLTMKTQTITNTFTYGDVNITLEETTGTEYKMVPGNEIAKDPKVTVAAGSEDCWLFVKLEKSNNYGTYLAEYEMAAGWTELEPGVYYREAKANDAFYVLAAGKGDGMGNGHVDVLAGVTKAQMEAIKTGGQPTLKVTAYAAQKANLTFQQAWDQVKGL